MSIFDKFPQCRRMILLCISVFVLLSITVAATAQADHMFVIGEISNIPYLMDDQGVIWGRQGFTRAALAEIGYIEGQNTTYIFDPEGYRGENIEAAAQALVEAAPDLIIAYGTAAAQIVRDAASNTSIPIVFVGTVDPVETGIVDSLQNLEGTTTGVGSSSEVYGKQLEWLLLLNPTIQRVYIPHQTQADLSNATVFDASLAAIQEFADASGVEIIVAEVPTANDEDLIAAAEALPEADVDAIMMLVGSPPSTRFAEVALALNLPLTTAFPATVNNGWLISYNVTEESLGIQAARYVDLILRGASPNSLPVELAPNVLAINLGTAETIGLEIPDEILTQAGIIIRP